jgi:site-specific DNA recombinase
MGKIKIEAKGDNPSQIVDGIHSPIISQELFYRVQEVLDGRRKKNAQPLIHSVHEKLPLRGILKCPKCGKKLTGSGSLGNGGRFFYYHCSKGCKVRFRAELANNAVDKIIRQIKVELVFKDLYKDVVNDYITKNGQSKESQQKLIHKKVGVLKARITNMENKYADNEINTMAFNEMKDRFSNELSELESHKSDLNTFSKDMDMQVEHCMKTISDIGKMYSNADAAIQREIVGSIFPEYIVFSNKKVRTVRVNEVVKLLCPSIARYETKKRGQKSEKSALSSRVVSAVAFFIVEHFHIDSLFRR